MGAWSANKCSHVERTLNPLLPNADSARLLPPYQERNLRGAQGAPTPHGHTGVQALPKHIIKKLQLLFEEPRRQITP